MYPAAGGRYHSTGKLNGIGNGGHYWIASVSGANGLFVMHEITIVDISRNWNRSCALSVRCIHQ